MVMLASLSLRVAATSTTLTRGTIASVGTAPGPESIAPLARAETFEAFYRREYHHVVALAYALTGRSAIAEELAQDAFLVTHRSWERVSSYDLPSAFVRRVVSNLAVSWRRRLAAEARGLARLASRPSPWAAPLEPPDADFWRSVRSLPRRQAQVLALRYLEDQPDSAIAHILGCSKATVRAHLHNGRLALADRLGIARNRSL
jgi:RNA polymerase sigma-70 factor, ECF subfamily